MIVGYRLRPPDLHIWPAWWYAPQHADSRCRNMLAQALVEYEMLSALAAAIQRTADTVENLVRGVDPTVAVGVIVIVMIGLLYRRR